MQTTTTNVRATYPIFMEIARRRQSIRRVLSRLTAPQVINPKDAAL